MSVFLDTGFAIALLSPRDWFHGAARHWAERIRAERIALLTTEAVVFEICAALAKVSYRAAAVRLVEGLRTDPSVEIVATDDALFEAAFDLFRSRLDKDWSLTDCLSFGVMRRRGVSMALAADEHVVQAGVSALLLGC